MSWESCVLVGPDACIRWISSENVTERGATREDFIGKPAWHGVHNPAPMRCALLECIATGAKQSVVTQTDDGRWHVEIHRFIVGELVMLVRQLVVPPHLTEMERDVLRLLGEDLTSKEIAARLDSTAQSVNTHRSAMRAKFSVKTTAGLMLAARDAGIL